MHTCVYIYVIFFEWFCFSIWSRRSILFEDLTFPIEVFYFQTNGLMELDGSEIYIRIPRATLVRDQKRNLCVVLKKGKKKY